MGFVPSQCLPSCLCDCSLNSRYTDHNPQRSKRIDVGRLQCLNETKLMFCIEERLISLLKEPLSKHQLLIKRVQNVSDYKG